MFVFKFCIYTSNFWTFKLSKLDGCLHSIAQIVVLKDNACVCNHAVTKYHNYVRWWWSLYVQYIIIRFHQGVSRLTISFPLMMLVQDCVSLSNRIGEKSTDRPTTVDICIRAYLFEHSIFCRLRNC